MSNTGDSGKEYRKECTGPALELARKHAEPTDITLFASCFCPFVQRVWAAFEYLQIPYQYCWSVFLSCSSSGQTPPFVTDEVDPYKKPRDLLDVSPKGLVPGLKLNNSNPPKALNESTVILTYINESVLKLTIFLTSCNLSFASKTDWQNRPMGVVYSHLSHIPVCSPTAQFSISNSRLAHRCPCTCSPSI